MGCGASSSPDTGASASNGAGSKEPAPASQVDPIPASTTAASASNDAGVSKESEPASQADSKPASDVTGSASNAAVSKEPAQGAEADAKSAETASVGNVDKPRVQVLQSSGQLSGALDSEEFDTAGAMGQIRILFDRLDKDGSGLVSKDEFIEEAPKISPKLFAGFDFHRSAGQDGVMSWLEFCAGMRSAGRVTKEVMQDVFKSTATEKDSEILEARLKEAKDEFDKVAGLDGVVDIMEFFSKANAMPLFKGVQFARAAGDDKVLSFEEFVDALIENGNIPSQTVEKKS